MTPLGRTVAVLRYASAVLFGVLIVLIAYCLYAFPYAPYRRVGDVYVDKLGQVHTRDEFDRLRVWERTYLASWIGFAATGVSCQIALRRQGDSLNR